MKNIKFIVIFLVLVNAALIGSYFLWFKQPKIAYIDNIEVFNGFNFTKERQAEYDKQKLKFQNKLDTLRMNHLAIEEALAQNPDNKELENRLSLSYELYQHMDYTYGVKLDSSESKFNNEVWGKLNTYITEYGEKKGYDMIIGASGTGNVMYGSESYNITKDIIEYSNEQYEGGE